MLVTVTMDTVMKAVILGIEEISVLKVGISTECVHKKIIWHKKKIVESIKRLFKKINNNPTI